MITVIDLKTMAVSALPHASVLCLGNFDGIHLGHRRLVDVVLRTKESLAVHGTKVAAGVWFFRTAPSEFLTGRCQPKIMSEQEKLRSFSDLGLDYAFLADFEELHTLSPEEFVKTVLQKECRCLFAVCGFNYRFAYKGTGDADTLVRLMDGQAHVVECLSLDGDIVSSTRIRALLTNGDVAAAARLLGSPYTLTAPVIHGKRLGRTLGVPTVNQHFPESAVLPKNGIYITSTELDGKSYPSVSNIGIRPSVEITDKVNCETHILGFDGDLYGKTLTVSFRERLRDELTFSSLEALTRQIQEDIQKTEDYYRP